MVGFSMRLKVCKVVFQLSLDAKMIYVQYSLFNFCLTGNCLDPQPCRDLASP